MDLTPYYPVHSDVLLWHKGCKAVCDKYDPNIYAEFKKNCDEYFFLKHRQETRGVGGLFFDDLNRWSFDECCNFTKEVGVQFIESYEKIIQNRIDCKFTEKEKDFQMYRRGRYAEFNLLYDRGTKFGIESNGRIESILMSMPPSVKWKYNFQAEPESKEEKLQKYLKPTQWIPYK